MKIVKVIISSIIISSTNAFAGSVTATIANEYVTRGIVCNQEEVSQLFADIPIGDKGFGLELFENIALTDSVETKGHVDELDVIPKYTFELPKDISITLGAAQYTFPNTEFEDTLEIFVKITHSLFNFTYWYDIDEVNSWYTSASITPNITFSEVITIGLNGTIGCGGSGYNSFYFNTDKTTINETVAGAYLSVTEDNFVTTVSMSRYLLFNDSIANGAVELYGKDDSTLLSISVAWLF